MKKMLKGANMGELHEVSHPVILEKLAQMRQTSTTSASFRQLLHQITVLLGFEATRDLPTEEAIVDTPVTRTRIPRLRDHAFTVVPVLRAGLGMTDGMLELLPDAAVGLIGLKRNETTHEPEEYYTNLPADVAESHVFLVDPMLATGGSAIDAVSILKRHGCQRIRMINLIAAPEGIRAFQEAHPDVDIFVASIDDCLNDQAFIVPGLGDAGDRIFGTQE